LFDYIFPDYAFLDNIFLDNIFLDNIFLDERIEASLLNAFLVINIDAQW